MTGPDGLSVGDASPARPEADVSNPPPKFISLVPLPARALTQRPVIALKVGIAGITPTIRLNFQLGSVGWRAIPEFAPDD